MRTRTLEIGICMAANVGEGGGGVLGFYLFIILYLLLLWSFFYCNEIIVAEKGYMIYFDINEHNVLMWL